MSFGLYRGGRWVGFPKRRSRSTQLEMVTAPSGAELWRNDLRLVDDPAQAWAADTLQLAIERAGVLVCLPQIRTVAVRRLP